MAKAERPFDVAGMLGGNWLVRPVEAAAARLSGLATLARLYEALPKSTGPEAFLEQVFDLFDIRFRLNEAGLAQIPRQGPAVVVANHPFGGIEGMILAAVLRRLRPDVKILANQFLCRIPELRELFIGVDPFGGKAAGRRNLGPLREALRWVRGGGLLVVFPAGEVAHLQPTRGRVTDPEWQPSVARLIRRSGAPVVPVWFAGANGPLFQLAGLLHPRLRTLLLPRQLLNKARRTLELRIGEAIHMGRLKGLKGDAALAAYLRLRTYMLRDLPPGEAPVAERAAPPVQALAESVAPELLAVEVSALGAHQRLAANGELAVYYARAAQIPWLLQEIGRLRELTFRQSGEGTGRASDIDLYDSYYLHLFVWNEARGELVGAYRLGQADRILARQGKRGLYTHSLFRYRSRLLHAINPALELGRSFIRPEYQRSFSPLLLLWKGIGAYVAAHPRYRILFGPVSISNDYHNLSQRMLVEFLRANNYLPELARHVRPRRPFRHGGRGWAAGEAAAVDDLEGLSELVSGIEADRKGVPILLRQYLKLGGRLLGFNVDTQFSDALDGLIMVDLTQTEPRVLEKYMGAEGAAAFLAYHQTDRRRSA